uniref:Uncharacterized protein n=1 Tax=Ciona intestinalis TaxID=7719 RepID=H2XLY0_CIOIN
MTSSIYDVSSLVGFEFGTLVHPIENMIGGEYRDITG